MRPIKTSQPESVASRIDRVKRSHSLDLTAQDMGIELTRRGSLSVALCPLHSERRPSFTLYPNQRYYCYGCGQHGDVIDLVAQVQRLDFPEALDLLDSEPARLPPANPSGAVVKPPRKRFMPNRAALTRLALYLNWILTDSRRGRPGRDYLTSRGLELNDRVPIGPALGYCPELSLSELAKQTRLSQQALRSAGAAINHDGRAVPRFAGAITIADIASDGVTAVHMSGRLIEPPVGLPPHISIPGEKPPLGLAGLPTDPDRPLYITEGALDWIALRSWNLDALATLGSHRLPSLTDQIEATGRRYLTLAFDQDKAGAELTDELAKLLSPKTDLTLTVATLPAGAQDVADTARLYRERSRREFLRLNP